MANRRSKPVRGRKTQAQSTNNTTRNAIIAAAVLVSVGILGYLLYLNLRPAPEITGVVNHPRPSAGHDQSITYDFTALPPVGGTHNPAWQNCGIYEEPVEAQYTIHSMEHGAVWITYQPDLPQEQIDQLQETVRGQNFLLLTPWPNLQSPIVLTAWGLQLEVDSADDERIDQFIERYQVGPQTPERGATCTNGVGEPLA
jgi:hypothetical protein